MLRQQGAGAHIKLLEDHEDDGNDQLGAVLALQDGLVGVLDQARLTCGLHNVVQLDSHVFNAARALEHLRSARIGLQVLPNPSSYEASERH